MLRLGVLPMLACVLTTTVLSEASFARELATIRADLIPALPGAINKLPDEVASGAPFDVKRYMALPSPELNAESLYLVALFEFDPLMVTCLPEIEDRARRVQIATDNQRLIESTFDSYSRQPDSVSDEQIRKLVLATELGMKEIRVAQKRPECVFRTSMRFGGERPHLEAMRMVGQFLELHAHFLIKNGEIDKAMENAAILLRMSRDVRPRGSMICQSMAGTLVGRSTAGIIDPILASPATSDAQLRRLLSLLLDHEAESLNGYEQAAKGEYLMLRMLLAQLKKEPEKAMSLVRPDGDFSERDLTEAEKLELEKVRVETRSKRAEMARVNASLSKHFRGAIELSRIPYPDWDMSVLNSDDIPGATAYGRIAKSMMPAFKECGASEQRVTASVRASECLIALSLYRKTTGKPASDLGVAVKAAGLKTVPIDPFSGRPLRMATIDGQVLVYSIGKDGRDEGGRVDSEQDEKSGDLISKLPAVSKPKG